jgi:hypothetical protein
MRFYHFKGGERFEFDAYIFAQTDQKAGELFIVHLIMNGESDDQMIWRELDPDEFSEPDRSSLLRALALQVDGVASRTGDGQWLPVPPFDGREAPD